MVAEKIGKPTNSMNKYFSPDAINFLEKLYRATGAAELCLYGEGINSSHYVHTLEQLADTLECLVPNSAEVISALELFTTLPESSVHQPIQVGHVFNNPQAVTKLAKHSEEIYTLFKELDKRKFKTLHYFGGVGNITLDTIDNILQFTSLQEPALEMLDEFVARKIVCYARDEVKEFGFLEAPQKMKLICDNKANYLRGLDKLLELGYSNENKFCIWGDVYSTKKCVLEIIELGKNESLQKLLEGLVNKKLISKSDLSFIVGNLKKIDFFSSRQEKLFEFVDSYHKLLKKYADKTLSPEDARLDYSELRTIFHKPNAKRFLEMLDDKTKIADALEQLEQWWRSPPSDKICGKWHASPLKQLYFNLRLSSAEERIKKLLDDKHNYLSKLRFYPISTLSENIGEPVSSTQEACAHLSKEREIYCAPDSANIKFVTLNNIGLPLETISIDSTGKVTSKVFIDKVRAEVDRLNDD
jgi:hypothetical protein